MPSDSEHRLPVVLALGAGRTLPIVMLLLFAFGFTAAALESGLETLPALTLSVLVVLAACGFVAIVQRRERRFLHLILSETGHGRLQRRDGVVEEGLWMGECWVSSWLVVLTVQCTGQKRRLSVWRHRQPENQFRRLRVRCLHSGQRHVPGLAGP